MNSPYAYSASYNPTLLPGGSGPVMAMNPMQFASYPNGSAFGNYPMNYGTASYPTNYIGASYPSTGTLAYQPYPNGGYYAGSRCRTGLWPSWSNAQGRFLVEMSFSRIKRRPRTSADDRNALSAASYASIASQTPITGTLRPSTAPLLPQNSANWSNKLWRPPRLS